MKNDRATTAITHEPSEAEIQKAAYQLWLEGGCRDGVELDDWFAAKERLIHHHGRDGGRTKSHGAPVSPASVVS